MIEDDTGVSKRVVNGYVETITTGKGHGVIQIIVRAEFRSVPIKWLWVQVCG